MELDKNELKRIIKEELKQSLKKDQSSMLVKENSEAEMTIKTSLVPLFREVLQKAELKNLVNKLDKKNTAGTVYVDFSISKSESKEIAKTINYLLDNSRLGYNSESERRKLEILMNDLPYMNYFLKY